jgi:hypothetical protein
MIPDSETPAVDDQRSLLSYCAFCNLPIEDEFVALITVKSAAGGTGFVSAHAECTRSLFHSAVRERFERLATASE